MLSTSFAVQGCYIGLKYLRTDRCARDIVALRHVTKRVGSHVLGRSVVGKKQHSTQISWKLMFVGK